MNEPNELPVRRHTKAAPKKNNVSNVEQSVLGFEKNHSLEEKVGLTLGFLITGPLLGLLYGMILFGPDWSPVWRWILERFVTLLAVFYFAALIFIWWRPHWLKKHYLAIERKLIQGIWVFFASIFLYGVAGAILSFFGINSNQF